MSVCVCVCERERERERERDTGCKIQCKKDLRNPTRKTNQQINVKGVSQIEELLSLFGVKSALAFSLKSSDSIPMINIR